ncbi:NAD-dependent epimerase/dehydratase [Pleurostoma richardsiae]|uniref:NAD-dependent epimerase/dehydratase n=1 Tax=Pleurostoma richardsiae TaxID=41990 RepID=A0AA38RRX8_9PEZI|nr:NAD-dependent epimerase/dehydratase [Pleurostoma richardsiae]
MPVSLVVGGHGKVASHLTRILTSETQPPHTVHSIIRAAEQAADVEKLGAYPIVQSVEEATVPELLTTLSRIKPDLVVWAAGAPFGSGDRIDKVDREGAIKVMDALAIAAQAGDTGKRFVSISALDLRDRENRPVPDWYDEQDKSRSDRLWAAIGPHLVAKLAADRELRTGNDKRGLDYTIVRPGGLNNDPGQKAVAAGKVHLGRTIAREDVARVVAECLKNDNTIGLAFDAVGGDDPVAEAVKDVGAQKIDTFEGYY